jgi:hypothetical protein
MRVNDLGLLWHCTYRIASCNVGLWVYPQETVLSPFYLHLPALMQRCFRSERPSPTFAMVRTAAVGTWQHCCIDKIQIDRVGFAVLCNVYIVYIATCGGLFGCMRSRHSWKFTSALVGRTEPTGCIHQMASTRTQPPNEPTETRNSTPSA